jgi:amidase
MMSQAPSSDTTGWFADDAEIFARVSAVMLGEAIPEALPTRLVIATDAFALADPEAAAALEPMVSRLGALVGKVHEAAMAPPGLAAWARAQRTLQPYEAWLTFQEWIDRTNPRFQFSVARNLVLGRLIPASERAWASLVRQEARGRMRQLLPPGAIICLPTTPFPAPLCGQSLSVLEPLRDRITALCAHGGLTGVPQVSIPGTMVDGLPVGLSILGARGSDAMLVAVARALQP